MPSRSLLAIARGLKSIKNWGPMWPVILFAFKTRLKWKRFPISRRMEQVDYDERNSLLALSISRVINEVAPEAQTGLDVGAQGGIIASRLAELTGIRFFGVEGGIASDSVRRGVLLRRAWADNMPFSENFFDVVTMTSVYEHIPAHLRVRSLAEIYRVLKPNGLLIGQIPNMNFPIELHSRLPFQQFLPRRLGDWYLRRFSPVPWRKNGTNWFRVTPNQLVSDAMLAGFRESEVRKFNYPKEVFRPSLRRFYPVLSIMPLGYLFWFRKEGVS